MPPAPGDAGCALGAALYADRMHFGNRDRDVPDHPFWGPEVDGDELARLAAGGRPGAWSSFDDEADLVARAADELAAGRIVGWMEGALRARAPRARAPQHPGRAARGGHARPAQPRHQVPRGVPSVRPRGPGRSRPSATSTCRRAARAWRASCRAYSRCGPSGASGSRRSRTSTAPRASRPLERAMAPRFHALLEAYGAPHRRPGAAQHLASTWPASRSSTARSRATRRSGAAASTCWSRATHWSASAPRRRRRPKEADA